MKSVCRWMGCWGRLQSQVLSEYACVQKAGDKFNGRHPRWRAKSQGNTDLNVSGNLRVLLANCVQYEPGWCLGVTLGQTMTVGKERTPVLEGKQEADGQGRHFSRELDTCLVFSSMSKV